MALLRMKRDGLIRLSPPQKGNGNRTARVVYPYSLQKHDVTMTKKGGNGYGLSKYSLGDTGLEPVTSCV